MKMTGLNKWSTISDYWIIDRNSFQAGCAASHLNAIERQWKSTLFYINELHKTSKP